MSFITTLSNIFMSTKMKNKPKFWRRLSRKTYDGTTKIRIGRHLRDKILNMSHKKILPPIQLWLFSSAGIAMNIKTGNQD